MNNYAIITSQSVIVGRSVGRSQNKGKPHANYSRCQFDVFHDGILSVFRSPQIKWSNKKHLEGTYKELTKSCEEDCLSRNNI